MAHLFAGLLGGGFNVIPAILAVIALVDCVRVGASWYWLWIILGFPVIGPIAYFIVVRSPALGGRQSALVSPWVARRLQARRRLRELQVQLAHWRGPGVLVEAGEELLVLGKLQEAEKHFREAQENGAAVEDVNYGLAQALEMQGRWPEAVALLEALIKVEPDSHLGEGPLHLGRSLDESGRRDEAEAVLRKVLERRTIIEAQVRLARILYLKGHKDEAGRLVAEVQGDAKLLPRYLKRRHRAWIAAARGLSATTRLPRPRIEGAFAPGERLRLALIATAAAVVLLLAAGFFMMRGSGSAGMTAAGEETQSLRAALDGLDTSHPWSGGDDLAKVDLTAADVDRYLRVRRGLATALQQEAHRRKTLLAQESEEESPDLAEWARTRNGVLRSLVQELDREGMGPRAFAELIALIDWRLLRRPEAIAFGLPEYARDDWMEVQWALDPTASAGDPEERRQLDKMRVKAQALQKQAQAAVDLSPATRTLLESRREELGKLEATGLDSLSEALAYGGG